MSDIFLPGDIVEIKYNAGNGIKYTTGRIQSGEYIPCGFDYTQVIILDTSTPYNSKFVKICDCDIIDIKEAKELSIRC